MLLLSCVNCSSNGLQYDTVGMSVGYCAEHKRVLNTPSVLTCGRLLRKDLLAPSARREREQHEKRYSPAGVCHLESARPANGTTSSDSRGDLDLLRSDPVATVVVDYGRLPTKIVSLAQLNMLPGARAELALVSLARAYVARCVDRQGPWTSGLHILWWTRKRLPEEPHLEINDIRVETPLPLIRQMDLAKWALLILRLALIADVAYYARSARHPIAKLQSLAEDGAVASDFSWRKLLRWMSSTGTRRFDDALPEAEYERLSDSLHKDPFDGKAG